MEEKRSTEPVAKSTKEGRSIETTTNERKSKKDVVDKKAKKNIPKISKSISIHSDLLTETYELNRKLLSEKDSLISLQKKYIDKCNEYNQKEEQLNTLKKRVTQLLKVQDSESNFINLTEEYALPIEPKLLEAVEGTNTIFS